MYVFSQGQIFVIFLILGLFIGIFFDIFRALRKTFKTIDLVTSIQDIFFVTVVGIFIVNTLILVNNGQIRFYIILAILFGITFYFLTISKLCFVIFQIFMKICKKILYFPIFFRKKLQKKKDFWYFCGII